MPTHPLDTIRPVLDEESTQKLREWERVLRERHGVRVSPQRMLNILIQNVEFIEVEQVIRISLKTMAPEGSKQKKQKPRLIIRTTKWNTGP